MIRVLLVSKNVVLTGMFLLISNFLIAQNESNDMTMQKEVTFYDLQATSIDGDVISMSDYKGKVVLIVNTASECGFTPQFEGLEKLHKEYGNKGLAILGFPCNQFGKQEPGSEEDIASFCQLNYGVTFQMFSKIEVNGDEAHPIYKFLKDHKSGLFGSKIKWNFTKFLIDKEGNVVDRFGSTTKPASIEKDIVSLLK